MAACEEEHELGHTSEAYVEAPNNAPIEDAATTFTPPMQQQRSLFEL